MTPAPTVATGLAGTEGAFLACSFWLADALHHTSRQKAALELFERLLGLRNDLGLLARSTTQPPAASSGTLRRRSATWA